MHFVVVFVCTRWKRVLIVRIGAHRGTLLYSGLGSKCGVGQSILLLSLPSTWYVRRCTCTSQVSYLSSDSGPGQPATPLAAMEDRQSAYVKVLLDLSLLQRRDFSSTGRVQMPVVPGWGSRPA
jgi:hypothetical protein